MRENPAQSQELNTAPKRIAAWFCLGVLCCGGIFTAGCSVVRKKPTVAWGTAIQTRPLPVAEREQTVDPPDSVPELNLVLTPLTSPIVSVPQPTPLRSRVAAAPSAAGNGARKTELPLLVPQLTMEEAAAAKQQTEQSLSVAEKNLSAAQNRNLGPAQTDLVSKVRSFLSDSRDAAQAGDWTRARNLAKKAQVLSEELVKSL
jgi:hypothetical protein